MLLDPAAHDCIFRNVESISVHDIDHETTNTVVIVHKLAELTLICSPTRRRTQLLLQTFGINTARSFTARDEYEQPAFQRGIYVACPFGSAL